MIILALLLSLIAIYLLQENGAFTSSLIKKISACLLFLLSSVLLSMEYGTLRGVFVFIGLVSLLGTVFTLLLYKLPSDR